MNEIPIGEIIAGILLIFIGWGKLGLKRDEVLLDDYKETKVERDAAKKELSDVRTELNAVKAESEKLNRSFLKLQDEVARLMSDKNTDRDTIKNLNAQLEDVPKMRQEISELRQEVNSITKTKEQLAEELTKAQDECKETTIQNRILQGKYEEATKNNIDAQNIIEAFTLIARQSNESVPQSEAQEGGEPKEAVDENQ